MTTNNHDQNEIETLITEIQHDIEVGKLKLDTAVEQEKTTSYWNIGKRIQQHIASKNNTEKYGQYLFTTLPSRLNINKRTLYYAARFYDSYPDKTAVQTGPLTWSHFKVLITIKSPETRKVYERLITDKKLSIRELKALVKSDSVKSIAGTTLATFPGTPYLYRITEKNNRRLLDLGFHTHIDHFRRELTQFNTTALIQVTKTGPTYSLHEANYEDMHRYTYKAFITKIIDGDTIKADIDLGFKVTTSQILRLRGINAYEITTPKGKQAKQFVTDRLSPCNYIVIKTYHPDKYSRFLADVYYSDSENDINAILTNGRFLNQELLDNNLAVKYYRY